MLSEEEYFNSPKALGNPPEDQRSDSVFDKMEHEVLTVVVESRELLAKPMPQMPPSRSQLFGLTGGAGPTALSLTTNISLPEIRNQTSSNN